MTRPKTADPELEPVALDGPPFVCPHCGQSFPNFQGISMHRSRRHEGTARLIRSDAAIELAARAKRERDRTKRERLPELAVIDDVMDRIGKATEALFPGGIPPQAVMLIGRWQESTIKMLGQI